MKTQLRLTDENLPAYLEETGLLSPASPGRGVEVTPAGDGNINWVRRIRLAGGPSWIVKQARPALEAFPEYEVTTERIVFEARYFERVRPFDAEGICPRVHHFDRENRVLVLEDLGEVPRLDHVLAAGVATAVREAAESLARFLGAVHTATRDETLAAEFENGAMQRLHGDHIFVLPLRENDFPLPEALRPRAMELQQDRELVAIADAAYERYLEPRGALVHADVQAGNVLLTPEGPKLLDPEISHLGDPAFDVGMLIAHLLLPGIAKGRPEEGQPAAAAAWRAYEEAHGGEGLVSFEAVARYAGLELVRRTIGAARVAAVADAGPAERVLDVGVRWILTPPSAP